MEEILAMIYYIRSTITWLQLIPILVYLCSMVRNDNWFGDVVIGSIISEALSLGVRKVIYMALGVPNHK